MERAYRLVLIDSGIQEVAYGEESFWQGVHAKNWDMVQAGVVIAQLIAVRLTVLMLSVPLLFIGLFAGTTDGVARWYLRKTSGGRESAFIYHRTKQWIGYALMGLVLVYLFCPAPIDPRWTIPPFAIFAGVAVSLTVTYFKKYL